MLPARTRSRPPRTRRWRALASSAALLVAVPGAGWAQDLSIRPGEVPQAEQPPRPLEPGEKPIDRALDPGPEQQTFEQAPTVGEGPVAFEADSVEYAYDAEVVTAKGNVVLRRSDQSVRADTVTWNRNSGKIEAAGNIRLVDQNGNQLFTDRIELTDELKAGAIDNLLIALRTGGRLAAASGKRDDAGRIELIHAAYTGCAVEDSEGCPKDPTWQVVAERVTYDPDARTIKFKGARLRIFGLTLLPLPGLALATDGRAISGTLIPDLRLSASNGIEISEGYYIRLADDKDLTFTGYVYTEAAPMLKAQYRQLLGNGAFQITGYATRSARIPLAGVTGQQTDFRGYLFGNGRFQLSPEWSLTTSVRVASDRTFLRRYDISRDDRLRSTASLERIDADSYLSLEGWATQTLRSGVNQGLVPVAFPVFDYRRRIADPWLGGRFELQANTLAITRTAGQDTQRAFAGARWDLSKLTAMGQQVTLTGLVRGDVYHTGDTLFTTTPAYRGTAGWQARGIALAALDVKWPLLGPALGGTQIFTPRVQLVASPPVRNLAVPNEDARAIDLEDSNLFALNRFPGYDRVEDGVRFTYGFDWQFNRPGWQVKTTVGQSYRLTNKPTLFPDGTGLSNRFSDFVGRTEVRFHDLVKLTHRFRLDKDDLAIRRNEFDATVGSQRTYVEVGYLRLNRNITSVEDLQDREELRFAARAGFAKYWSVFGAGVINLTDAQEDPSAASDGFQPLRTRLGVAYEDDCLQLALTWQRDYVETGDARKGNTFQISFALRNLGFR